MDLGHPSAVPDTGKHPAELPGISRTARIQHALNVIDIPPVPDTIYPSLRPILQSTACPALSLPLSASATVTALGDLLVYGTNSLIFGRELGCQEMKLSASIPA